VDFLEARIKLKRGGSLFWSGCPIGCFERRITDFEGNEEIRRKT
jgi:hypothetical protein